MILILGKNSIIFKFFGVELVGDLYFLEGFDENKKYKVIVGVSLYL